MKKVLLLLLAALFCSGSVYAQPKKTKELLKNFTFCDYEYDDFEQFTYVSSNECGGSGTYFVMSFKVYDDGTVSKMNIYFGFQTNFNPKGSATQSGIDLVKVRFGEFSGDDKKQSESIEFPMQKFEIKGPFQGLFGTETWVQRVNGDLSKENIDILIDKFSNNEAAEMRGYARVASDGNLYTTSSKDENVRETVRDEDEFRKQAKFLKEYKKLLEKVEDPYGKEETTESK